jgi:uncharacterized membrane protein
MDDVEGVHHVEGGTLPAKVFAQTWDNLRTLRSGGRLGGAPSGRGGSNDQGAGSGSSSGLPGADHG